MKPVDIERWQELEDLKYRASLVQCRIAAGITVHDIAVAAGVSDSFIERIEDFTADPHLSTLRRYAAAIGAAVHHSVRQVPADEEPEGDQQ
jgi:predicted transcriptional regulator